jgi:large subunit ribosomal protein L25
VPLRVIGEHERPKDGAVIEQLMHEVDISCLPSAIPECIEVDVSGLKVGDTIDVNDLYVKDGIKIRSRPEDSIVTAVIPVKAAELESLSPEHREPVAAG